MKTLNTIKIKERAFTLIEILTVIAIIGIVASFTMPVYHSALAHADGMVAKSDMSATELLLEQYKARYSVYPPSGTNVNVNPLGIELTGAEKLNGKEVLLTGQPLTIIPSVNGMGGVYNHGANGSVDNVPAVNFLANWNVGRNHLLKYGSTNYYILVSHENNETNVIHYSYPGTNNPSSYDLWIDYTIGRKTYTIDNWK